MARKVAELPTRSGRPAKYDWTEFLDGNVWELEKGKDYTSQSTSFVSQARKQAEQKGMVLVSRTVESEPLRQDPDNPKSKFVRDKDGNVREDATIIRIQAMTPEQYYDKFGRYPRGWENGDGSVDDDGSDEDE